jgi:hypothetical protein
MEVTDDSHVKISYKGNELTPPGGLPTTFAPRAARIVFGGRTGGAWSAMDVDNIRLVTTPFTSAAVSGFSGNAGGFTVQIQDQGTTTLDPASLVLQLNGTAVTATMNKIGAITYAHYTADPLLAIGSTNTVNIAYKDNFGVASTAVRVFKVASYGAVSATYALPAAATLSDSGFDTKVIQISVGRNPGDANSTANADRQLDGGFIDPTTGVAYVNMAHAGTYNGTDFLVPLINWNENPGNDGVGGADIGDFKATNPPPGDVADNPIPGIDDSGVNVPDPTAFGYDNNIVSRSTAYLTLKKGYYTFGVNSDDGFRVSMGWGAADDLGQTVGEFSGGKGSSDVLFDVAIPADGVYPVRLEWWQGGGGANCEFFYVDQVDGTKRLINDLRDATHQITAFAKSSLTRPSILAVSPERNQDFVFANADVWAQIADGTTTVDSGSVALWVNGVKSAASATSAGGVTTIKQAGGLSSLLLSGGNTNTLVYSFTESGTTTFVTNSWTFHVTPYTWLQAATKVDTGSATGSGFTVIAKQIDKTGDANQGNGRELPAGDSNRMPRPEFLLAGDVFNPTNGLAYPNTADLTTMNADGTYTVADVFNFNNPSGNSGIFPNDNPFPGSPGHGSSNAGDDNYVAEFMTWLDLKAGVYLFGVNSDDGFLATSAPDPHDTLGTVLGIYNGGRGNSGNLVDASAFEVVVPQDGTYPFRVLYWEGGGGMNGEFFSVDKASGTQTLVNDLTSTLAVVAHATGPSRPWVTLSVSPTPWDNRIMQNGPGALKAWGGTHNDIGGGGDIYNWQDNTGAWPDVGIGGVFTNLGSATVGMLIDGTNSVTPTVTTSGGLSTVVYNPTTPLSGGTHTASLIYAGTTNTWSFSVLGLTNVDGSMALPMSAADTTAVGWKAKVVQSVTGQNNTVLAAEELLAGVTPSVALPGTNSDGTYTIPGIINWNNNLNPTTSGGAPILTNTQIGNFQTDTYGAWPYAAISDYPIPGLPGTGRVNCDNSAIEAFAYVAFPAAGIYHFGVNSDDGFAVKVGLPGSGTNSAPIFALDAGKGSSDVPFAAYIPQAGLYPIRLVWYNGGGGANCEFFVYDATGNKIPINDAGNPASLKAYYNATGVTPPGPLKAALNGDGSVTISWTGAGTLQQASSLKLPVSWSNVAGVSGNSYVVPAAATGYLYFRLTQ